MGVGSISAVSRVRSLILPEKRMSVGSFSRTAAGNRAYHGGIPYKDGLLARKFHPPKKHQKLAS